MSYKKNHFVLSSMDLYGTVTETLHGVDGTICALHILKTNEFMVAEPTLHHKCPQPPPGLCLVDIPLEGDLWNEVIVKAETVRKGKSGTNFLSFNRVC